ncbi:MAG: hypothetical protein AAF645_29895, partial [Myxococcota bacterium]
SDWLMNEPTEPSKSPKRGAAVYPADADESERAVLMRLETNDSAGPTPLVDRRILAAAARVADQGRADAAASANVRRTRRWLTPALASAATLVLAVTLTFQLFETPSTGVEQAVSSVEATSAEGFAGSETAARAARSTGLDDTLPALRPTRPTDATPAAEALDAQALGRSLLAAAEEAQPTRRADGPQDAPKTASSAGTTNAERPLAKAETPTGTAGADAAAYAATSRSSPAPYAADETEVVLEEVLVTARSRKEMRADAGSAAAAVPTTSVTGVLRRAEGGFCLETAQRCSLLTTNQLETPLDVLVDALVDKRVRLTARSPVQANSTEAIDALEIRPAAPQ